MSQSKNLDTIYEIILKECYIKTFNDDIFIFLPKKYSHFDGCLEFNSYCFEKMMQKSKHKIKGVVCVPESNWEHINTGITSLQMIN